MQLFHGIILGLNSYKNGYIKFIDYIPTGGTYCQVIVLFSAVNNNNYLGIDSSEDIGQGIQNTKCNFYQYSNDNWVNTTKQILPDISINDFFDKQDFQSEYSNRFQLYYKLPRFGTTIKVIPVPINDPLETIDNEYFLLNKIKYESIDLNWDFNKGLFVIGNKNSKTDNYGLRPLLSKIENQVIELPQPKTTGHLNINALFDASKNGDIEFIKKSHGDVNFADTNGYIYLEDSNFNDIGTTALMIAARNGKTDVVSALIKAGAKVNTMTKYRGKID